MIVKIPGVVLSPVTLFTEITKHFDKALKKKKGLPLISMTVAFTGKPAYITTNSMYKTDVESRPTYVKDW